MIDGLSAAGCRLVEAASFVSPKWVPQMADGREVMAGIRRGTGVRYAALTPNVKGLKAAIAADVDEVKMNHPVKSRLQYVSKIGVMLLFTRGEMRSGAGESEGLREKAHLFLLYDLPGFVSNRRSQ